MRLPMEGGPHPTTSVSRVAVKDPKVALQIYANQARCLENAIAVQKLSGEPLKCVLRYSASRPDQS